MAHAGANEPGLEQAPEDWWIEDRVTSVLREAKPKARSLQLTDAEATRFLEAAIPRLRKS